MSAFAASDYFAAGQIYHAKLPNKPFVPFKIVEFYTNFMLVYFYGFGYWYESTSKTALQSYVAKKAEKTLLGTDETAISDTIVDDLIKLEEQMDLSTESTIDSDIYRSNIPKEKGIFRINIDENIKYKSYERKGTVNDLMAHIILEMRKRGEEYQEIIRLVDSNPPSTLLHNLIDKALSSMKSIEKKRDMLDLINNIVIDFNLSKLFQPIGSCTGITKRRIIRKIVRTSVPKVIPKANDAIWPSLRNVTVMKQQPKILGKRSVPVKKATEVQSLLCVQQKISKGTNIELDNVTITIYHKKTFQNFDNYQAFMTSSHRFCKDGVSQDYLKESYEQCEYVLVIMANPLSDNDCSTKLCENTQNGKICNITIGIATIKISKSSPKAYVKDTVGNVANCPRVQTLKRPLEKETTYRYNPLTDTQNPRFVLSSKPDDVYIYVDVLCSYFQGFGAEVLKFLNDDVHRNNLLSHWQQYNNIPMATYAGLSLRGVPSVYGYYILKGFIRRNHEGTFPLFYVYNNDITNLAKPLKPLPSNKRNQQSQEVQRKPEIRLVDQVTDKDYIYDVYDYLEIINNRLKELKEESAEKKDKEIQQAKLVAIIQQYEAGNFPPLFPGFFRSFIDAYAKPIYTLQEFKDHISANHKNIVETFDGFEKFDDESCLYELVKFFLFKSVGLQVFEGDNQHNGYFFSLLADEQSSMTSVACEPKAVPMNIGNNQGKAQAPMNANKKDIKDNDFIEGGVMINKLIEKIENRISYAFPKNAEGIAEKYKGTVTKIIRRLPYDPDDGEAIEIECHFDDDDVIRLHLYQNQYRSHSRFLTNERDWTIERKRK